MAASAVYSAHGLTEATYKYLLPMLITNDSLPLLLWLVLFSEELQTAYRAKPA